MSNACAATHWKDGDVAVIVKLSARRTGPFGPPGQAGAEVAKPKRMRYANAMGTVPKVASMTADEKELAVVRDYQAGDKPIQQIQDEYDLTSPSTLYRILAKHGVKPGRANGNFDVNLGNGHTDEQATTNGAPAREVQHSMPTITGTIESDDTDGPQAAVDEATEPVLAATPPPTSPSVDREGGAVVRPRSGQAPAERRGVFADRPLSPRVAAAMHRVPTPPPDEQVEMRAAAPAKRAPTETPPQPGEIPHEVIERTIEQALADVEIDRGVQPYLGERKGKTYEVVVEYRTRSVVRVTAETLTTAARQAEAIESPTGGAAEVISMTLVESGAPV